MGPEGGSEDKSEARVGGKAEQVPAGRLEAEGAEEMGRRAGGRGRGQERGESRREGGGRGGVRAQNKKGPLWKQKAV